VSLFVLPDVTVDQITTDGSSPELAWYSPRSQIIYNGPILDGLYWQDENQGLGSPFLAYASGSLMNGGFYTRCGEFGCRANDVLLDLCKHGLRLYSVQFLTYPRYCISRVRSGRGHLLWGAKWRHTYLPRFLLWEVLRHEADIHKYHSGFAKPKWTNRRQLWSPSTERNYDTAVYVRESMSAMPRTIPEPSTALLVILSALGCWLLVRRRSP